MHGAPRIAGRRIRVQDIAVFHTLRSRSVEEIADEFQLTRAEVHAALAFYYDHRFEIDEAIQADAEAVEEFAQSYPSKLTRPTRG